MTVSIKKLVKELAKKLTSQHLSLVTAESCTGGGLSYWLTSLSGSSEWFERGFVTYSDQSKIDMLGINPSTIDSFGAVSEQTAREMAEGALRNSAAALGIAITGIAGPTGGSALKPVGTVWIALAKANSMTHAQSELFPGNREQIRKGVIVRALELLLFHL
jgi:nicotinamide-nucleotide amidase